jgi:hypothetical protein
VYSRPGPWLHISCIRKPLKMLSRERLSVLRITFRVFSSDVRACGLRASESSSAALVGLTLAELHGGSGHVARLIRGEAAFADRRHCSLISREDQIPGREGGTITIIMMNTSRFSRCHQEPGLVAANKSLFKRARCVSVMVRT